MLGGSTMLNPWVGPDYPHASVKLLVLGESRSDKHFSDRKIIRSIMKGEFDGGQRATFTKFERAVLGSKHSEAERQAFWNATLFHNYNVNFFPGKSRVPLPYSKREDPQNVISLKRVLRKHKPSHVIVWGKWNWDSIDVRSSWTDHRIPNTRRHYSRTIIDDHALLFTHVPHPSSAFSPRRLHPALSRFLALTA
jgi:hypothetical protein